jgi:hypothetical protein
MYEAAEVGAPCSDAVSLANPMVLVFAGDDAPALAVNLSRRVGV